MLAAAAAAAASAGTAVMLSCLQVGHKTHPFQHFGTMHIINAVRSLDALPCSYWTGKFKGWWEATVTEVLDDLQPNTENPTDVIVPGIFYVHL